MNNGNLQGEMLRVKKAILTADRKRYKALHEADISTLEHLLHERFYYTHSSGRTDSKSAYIDNIRSGKVRYGKGTNREVEIDLYGSTAVMHGQMTLDCFAADGEYYPLNNRFTSVWVDIGSLWQLVAWASTPIAASP